MLHDAVPNISSNDALSTTPTIAFNRQTVKPNPDWELTIWDVSGQRQMRPFWPVFYHYHFCDGLIFVVDSKDGARIEEVKLELDAILSEHLEIRDVPLLILANKQDLPGALSISELNARLNLHIIAASRKWHIQPTSASSGQGLEEGMAALITLMEEYQKYG